MIHDSENTPDAATQPEKTSHLTAHSMSLIRNFSAQTQSVTLWKYLLHIPLGELALRNLVSRPTF